MELYLYFGIDDTVSNEGAVNNNNKFIYLYKSIYEGLPKSKVSYFFMQTAIYSLISTSMQVKN